MRQENVRQTRRAGTILSLVGAFGVGSAIVTFIALLLQSGASLLRFLDSGGGLQVIVWLFLAVLVWAAGSLLQALAALIEAK